MDALCQHCSQEFDWDADECPHCGWERRTWVDAGRYGLEKSHA